ncbi:MAG: hypothetical protein JWQ35_1523 [Bacteriovoracaceae bacterium]|nr:hypothetical protein [Bacteriovoracaceae bacterium]
MKSYKRVIVLCVGAVFLYSALMIIIRLRITELGYEFEEAKAYERELREEQLKLRVDLADLVSEKRIKSRISVKGFAEPEPKQIVVIP